MKKIVPIALCCCTARLFAHDVVWMENRFGDFGNLAAPLTIYYRLGDPAVVAFPPFRVFNVAPTSGEKCVVEVQMDKPASQLIEIPDRIPPTDNDVPITVQLAALPLTSDRITNKVTGKWRAVAGQGPKCDATNWTEFTVPIVVAAAPKWTVWADPVLKTFNADTGGLPVGLRDTCGGIGGPSKIIAYGSTFSFDWRMRPGAHFFSGIVERYAEVIGSAMDGSGKPLAGWQFGLSEGGLNTKVNDLGTFQIDPLPRGMNAIRGWTMLPYTDPMTGRASSQYVGIITPIPSTQRFETFDLKMNAQVFPSTATPDVPWLTIGFAKLNGLDTSLIYAGGAGAPAGTSRRDSGLQLWVIPPSGMSFTIPIGPREENFKINPDPGVWAIEGQLPNQPKFHLDIKYQF